MARRGARTEFIRFLMRQNAQTQAQAEAMILASGVPENDIEGRFQAAKLLLDTGEYNRAFDAYSSLIKNDAVRAASGAGEAAFRSGKFDSAARYLNTAIAHGSKEQSAQSMLQRARQVLDADPDRRRIGNKERARRVNDAFELAGRRLEYCATSKGQTLETTSPVTDLQKLYAERLALSSTFNQKKLAEDPDLRDSVMDLVSRMERTTTDACGMPSGTDWALLMLARYGEGVEH
jgi:tetratricopeptide (TPR) repeat protein